MISVITAVHNHLAMNRVFLKHLKANTRSPFELIVIDNASNDGSADFFEQNGAIVLRNEENLSYPRSQNMGIERAKFQWFAFLNNDVIVSRNWDTVLMQSMLHNELEVATSCGIEQVESPAGTRQLRRRWRWVRSLVGMAGTGLSQLEWMHRLMYPHWQSFCTDRQVHFRRQVVNGFVGNTVMMRRSALDKIGLWDERIQQADFDLYLRVAARRRSHGDLRDMHIALDCFVHHYIRWTANSGHAPFADRETLIGLDDKWDSEQLAWLPDLHRNGA